MTMITPTTTKTIMKMLPRASLSQRTPTNILRAVNRYASAALVSWDEEDLHQHDNCQQHEGKEITSWSEQQQVASMLVSWPASETNTEQIFDSQALYTTRPFYLLDGGGGRIGSLCFLEGRRRIHHPDDGPRNLETPGAWLGQYHDIRHRGN